MTRDLNPVVTVTQVGGIIIDNMQDTVEAMVTNHDDLPHRINVQANLYDRPATELGDDPSDFLITSGFVDLTLKPHESRRVRITARNVENIPPLSATFRVTGD